jgi:hypothetical protein
MTSVNKKQRIRNGHLPQFVDKFRAEGRGFAARRRSFHDENGAILGSIKAQAAAALKSALALPAPAAAKSPQAGLAVIESGRAPLQQVLRDGRDLDVDLEQGDGFTALDPDLDLIGIDRDVLADRRDDILAQNGNEVCIARAATLMHQQDLEPMLSGLGRSLAAE